MASDIKVKVCSSCKLQKAIECFSPSPAYKDGFRGQCKKCRTAYQREYEKTEAGRISMLRHKKTDGYKRRQAAIFQSKRRYARYGLSKTEFQDLLARQGGRCAICGTTEPGGKHGTFNIDHCHETGRVRGILCQRCNIALASLGDSLDGVMRFARYLRPTANS
jgi:hypothetical protein